MNNLKLYNTANRKVTDFEPVDNGNIKIYACGPTVYDFIHIGNARPLVIFDILVRLLRKIYPKVTYVRNITDIDDKIKKSGIFEVHLIGRNRRIYIEQIKDLGQADALSQTILKTNELLNLSLFALPK